MFSVGVLLVNIITSLVLASRMRHGTNFIFFGIKLDQDDSDHDGGIIEKNWYSLKS